MGTLRRVVVRRAGFSLVEVAIALTLVGLVLGSILHVMASADRGYTQGSLTAQVQTTARRAVERVAAEFENAGRTTLLPNPLNVACQDLVFQNVVGVDVDDGTPIFDSSTRLRFAYDPGEADNGLDDDGDGLIDEGRVVLTRNYLQADEVSVVLARGIDEILSGETQNGGDDNANGLTDERGFCMTLEGSVLVLRLSMSRAAPDGTRATGTVEATVSFRN